MASFRDAGGLFGLLRARVCEVERNADIARNMYMAGMPPML